MDLEKKYYIDGVQKNILQMVKEVPEWAANRIQVGEKYIMLGNIEKILLQIRSHTETILGDHSQGPGHARIIRDIVDKYLKILKEQS